MMKPLLMFVGTAIAVTAITACNSTTVIPQIGDIFTVTSTQSTPTKAYCAAASKAKDVCEQQGSKLTILDHQTVYQGLNKSEQTLNELSDKLLGNSCGPDTPPLDHNYKTTITFKCD